MKWRSRRGWLVGAVVGAVLAPIAVVAVIVPASAADAVVHTYRATPGDVASDRFSLTANNISVFVTKYANRSNNRMAVARFSSSSATPTLRVTNNATITSWKIHPARHYPASAVTVSGNTLTFNMSSALRYAIVEVNGTQPGLAIVNDPHETATARPDPNAANVVDVADYVTDLTGRTDQTTNIRNAINALYSNSGKNTLYFPDGHYMYAGLDLRNRTKTVRIYVDEGALLKNRMQPTMEAMEPAIGIWDSSNITIEGRGVFDGNGFANYDTSNGGWRHDAATSNHQGGVMIVRSSNIVFRDTLLRDSKQWNWETHTAANVTFNNIKGLTPYAQPWIDGINLASGQNVTVNGALTLGNDDTFASGHYNPNDQFLADPNRNTWDTKDTYGIAVNNHLGWSANAGNGIRIGHRFGYQLRDYTFTNVHYLGFGAANGIGVANLDSAEYPRYETIIVRNSSFDTSKVGTNLTISGKQSSNAADRIGTVTLDNVWFSHNKPSNISHVTNLTIRNLYLPARATSLSQAQLTLTNVANQTLDFTGTDPGGSAGTIVNQNSGKCVEVLNGSTANSAKVVQTACDGATDQQWTLTDRGGGYYNIVSVKSGKCLDVASNSTANGAGVIQYTCGSGANQQWQLRAVGSYYELVARHSGKCLDVPNRSTSDGTQLVQWTCNGGTNQRWTM